ncbi:uncharacterized protein A4U43_C08F14620 [Asparagus officinalis]|nr:uncharacterized protein A4U43_C08F14620 [Asparagus officinalis]
MEALVVRLGGGQGMGPRSEAWWSSVSRWPELPGSRRWGRGGWGCGLGLAALGCCHDGTHDPEVTHVFDGSIPLFLNDNSQERIEAIRIGSKNRDHGLREFLAEGMPDEDWEVPGNGLISLDDDEEKMDYEHDDTDAYLIEIEDASDAGNIGGSLYMPDDKPDFGAMGEVAQAFSTSGHFKPVVDFEGASGALESTPAINTTEAPVPALIS